MTSWFTPLAKAFAQPFKWWFVVAPWEQALRVRLGHRAELMQPGIHFRIPFLDRVYRQSMRLRQIFDRGQTVTTRDGHPLSLSTGIEFSISNLRQLYSSLANPEGVLLNRVRAAISEYVSQHERSALHPLDVAEHCTEVVRATEQWGLREVRVFVVSFVYTKTFRLMQSEYESFTGLDVDRHDDEPRR